MKNGAKFACSMVLFSVVSLIAAVQMALAAAQPQKSDMKTQTLSQTTFTYQGQLKDANGPVNGSFDFQFAIYSAQTGGERLGVIQMKEVALTNGMFSFKLDFGRVAMEAKENWLEISVRPSGSADAYTVLFPRQKLTPTPYAIFAQHEQWSLIGVPVGFVDQAVMTEGASKVMDKEDETQRPEAAAAAPQATPNFIAKFDSRGLATADSVMFDNGTNVGIGTTNPGFKLHINGVAEGISIQGTSQTVSNQAYMSFRNSAGTRIGYVGDGSEGDNNVFLASDTGDVTLITRAGRVLTATASGNVGIGTTAPDAKLHVFGPVRVHAAPPNDTTPVNAEFVLTNRGAGGAPYTWRLQTAAVGGGFGVNPNALEIWEYPQDATPGCCIPRLRILPGGNLGSAPAPVTILENGTLQTGVLQILGGGDLAEPFEISDANSIQPGFVVAIDPDRPGQLRMADRAYDRTVAGIISGAGGINPGLTMKQEGTVADGSQPVSLTGRVYCWADASYGPIAPGDLLTTSDTPGHAMKVTDHAKAQGAIIGKAMTPLAEGKGLVLVLVSLQ